MGMLYIYRDAFSLRDEIGTCPNIDVEKYTLQIDLQVLLDHIILRKKIKLL